MRLFIAFDIPEKVKEQLVSIQKQIKTDAKINWVKPENMHLTLKFLGDVDDVEDVKKSLENVCFEAFGVSTSDIGVFPSEKNIRVIWVGLDDKRCNLSQLVEQINYSLPNSIDDNEFHAHLTVGRVRFVGDKKKLIDELKKIKLKLEWFSLKEFKLYKSTLTSSGSVYEEIGVFSAK